MIPFALVAAILVAARMLYPRLVERRQGRRNPMGSDGVIIGANAIDLAGDESKGAVLLIHGSGDTPHVMAGLASHLNQRGFSVRAPLLANHGRLPADIHRFNASEWREQVRTEYDNLRARHRWVGVAGISMGGALALALAVERRTIDALVVFAPWIDMPVYARRLARTGYWWGVVAPYLPSLGGRSIHDPVAKARGLSHGLVTPASMRALLVMADLAQDALPQVEAPTLVIQSREDNRIPVAAAEAAFAKLGAKDKRFVWTEGAGHVITVDYGKERVFSMASEWLELHRRV